MSEKFKIERSHPTPGQLPEKTKEEREAGRRKRKEKSLPQIDEDTASISDEAKRLDEKRKEEGAK